MLTSPQRTATASSGGYVGFAVGSQSGAVAYAVHRSATANGTYTQVLNNQAFAPSAELYGLINYQKSTVAFREQTNWPTTFAANTVGLIADTAGQHEFVLLEDWAVETEGGESANILNLLSGIYHTNPIEVSTDDSAQVYALSNVVVDTTLHANNATVYYKIAPIDAQGNQLALNLIEPIAIQFC
jgi:hypothetical protein